MDAETTLPGLTVEEFRAASETLVELRDAGKFLFFYSRRTGARVVRVAAEADDFRVAVGRRLGDKVDEKFGRMALRELRNFLGTTLVLEDPDAIVGFLTDQVFRENTQVMDEAARTRFEDVLREKVKLTSEILVDGSLRRRAERLRSSIAPTLEELDTEVVGQRRDEVSNQNVETPFLRLRFRYSVIKGTSFEVLPVLPWGMSPVIQGTPGFELECDESDIDLMLHRLREAKKRLGEAVRAKLDEV